MRGIVPFSFLLLILSFSLLWGGESVSSRPLPSSPGSSAGRVSVRVEPEFLFLSHPFVPNYSFGGGFRSELSFHPGIPLPSLDPGQTLLSLDLLYRSARVTREIADLTQEGTVSQYQGWETSLRFSVALGYPLGDPETWGVLTPSLAFFAESKSMSLLGENLIGPGVKLRYRKGWQAFSLGAGAEYLVDLDRRELPLDLAGTPAHLASFGLDLDYDLCGKGCGLGGGYQLETLIFTTQRVRWSHIFSLFFQYLFS